MARPPHAWPRRVNASTPPYPDRDNRYLHSPLARRACKAAASARPEYRHAALRALQLHAVRTTAPRPHATHPLQLNSEKNSPDDPARYRVRERLDDEQWRSEEHTSELH